MPSPLIAFLDDCARYEPDFPKHAQGASHEALQRVEAVAPAPIPVELRELWMALGVPAGPFNGPFPRDLAWGIEATLDFYATRPVPPPKDAVHLASVLDAETHFFLPIEGEPWKRPVLLLTWGFDETTGAWVESARQKTVMAPSLLSYLYERAFLTLRVPKLPHEQVLHGEAPPGPKSEAQRRTQRQALETFVQKLRFHPVPHVDDRAVFYDRPEGALLFYPSVHAHDALYVFAADARERTLLAELVCDNLDFHPAG